MKQLYDEIIALKYAHDAYEDYDKGCNDGIELSAELVKKRIDADANIERVNKLLDIKNKITELSEYVEEMDPTIKLTQDWQKLLNALTVATEELIK